MTNKEILHQRYFWEWTSISVVLEVDWNRRIEVLANS